MTKHRYLAKYGELNGMNVVFGEMQKILPNNAGMENAVEALEMHYELIENGFIEYFPILLTDSQHKLLDLFGI
jgi:acyl carrier protein phosphodiesterase